MVLTLKKLLLSDENWYRYHQFYSEHGEIRSAVESSINKILSCHHYARGHARYHCSNSDCTHEGVERKNPQKCSFQNKYNFINEL